jgi:hypothetical protein
MPKKTKTKYQKEMNSSIPNYKQKTQWDIEEAIKPPKIKEKEIFDSEGGKGKPKKTKSKTSTRKKY